MESKIEEKPIKVEEKTLGSLEKINLSEVKNENFDEKKSESNDSCHFESFEEGNKKKEDESKKNVQEISQKTRGNLIFDKIECLDDENYLDYSKYLKLIENNQYEIFFNSVENDLIKTNYFDFLSKNENFLKLIKFKRFEFINDVKGISNLENFSTNNFLESTEIKILEQPEYVRIFNSKIWDNFTIFSILALSYIEVCIANKIIPRFSSIIKNENELNLSKEIF